MPTFWLNSQRTRNMAIDDHWKVNNAATAPRWNAAITAKNTQLNSSDLSCSNSTGREASSDCDSARRVDMGYPSRLSTDWLWVRPWRRCQTAHFLHVALACSAQEVRAKLLTFCGRL